MGRRRIDPEDSRKRNGDVTRLTHGARLAGVVGAATLAAGALAGPALAGSGTASKPAKSVSQHVLLISVDGLHALDVSRYVSDHPASALAELAGHGLTYSNAHLPANSDSFPGLLALVTGGSPVSHGSGVSCASCSSRPT